jgi:hypothetical protein
MYHIPRSFKQHRINYYNTISVIWPDKFDWNEPFLFNSNEMYCIIFANRIESTKLMAFLFKVN